MSGYICVNGHRSASCVHVEGQHRMCIAPGCNAEAEIFDDAGLAVILAQVRQRGDDLERLHAWFGDHEQDPPPVEECIRILDRMRTSEVEAIAGTRRGRRPDAPTLVDARVVYPAELGGPGKWFPCLCPRCGWRGLSRDSTCERIGDDWDDPKCPRCDAVLEDDPIAEFAKGGPR